MYIIDCHCISPQKTFNNSFFEGKVVPFSDNKYYAIEPSYNELIPKGLLRRMGKAVRIGIGAGLPLLQKHHPVDGIILGTATGGLNDCVKFLNQIVQYEEGTLTPTNFVQSTPNSIAGHLALMSKNNGYNNTHMGIGIAFEATILDAIMLFEENEATKLLIGNVEETSSYDYNIDSLAGFFKAVEVPSSELLNSNTKGSVRGEGAAMFMVSNKKENAICKVVDVNQFTHPQENNIEERAEQFLAKNKLSVEDVDSLVLGFSGDNRHDCWYSDLMNSFKSATVYSYKNLVGEYPTTSGFAMWLATNILQGKQVPKEAVYKEGKRTPKNILIYNNYVGNQHGFILLQKV